jgi:hypothetical protein
LDGITDDARWILAMAIAQAAFCAASRYIPTRPPALAKKLKRFFDGFERTRFSRAL